MLPVDREFVRSTWSSSYRLSDYAGLVPMDRWADVMHPIIDRLLDSPHVRTLVAHEPGEPDHLGRPYLYGFIASSSTLVPGVPYVLYAYVKASYRRGVSKGYAPFGRLLFEAAGIDPRKRFVYACRTGIVADLASKIPCAEFDPLPARFMEPKR